MKKDITLSVDDQVFEIIMKRKNAMGFSDIDLNTWLTNLACGVTKKESKKEILERVFNKNADNVLYDEWIKNFALNLNYIWNEKSARELTPSSNEKINSSALVIGFLEYRTPALSESIISCMTTAKDTSELIPFISL